MQDQNNNTPVGAAAPADLTTQNLVIDDTPPVAEVPVAPPDAPKPVPEAITMPTEEKPPLEKRPDSTTVQQDAEIYYKAEPWDELGLTIPLPGDTLKRTQEALGSLPNESIDPEWFELLKESRGTVQYRDAFTDTLERDGSQWRQYVQSERGALSAAAPSFKDTVNTKLTGERAVLRVRALVGLGSIVQVPLWHSGFWITLKAASEAEMLELNRRLAEEKINLGRATYGLAFSNTSVVYAGALIDFVMDHLYDCSLKDNRPENVRAQISSLDIPLLVWGMAVVQWPRGFQYVRAVVDAADPNKIVREKLNVGKLLWTDTTALTAWQTAHMAQRSGNTMTNEALERYRSEFTRGQGRQIALQDGLLMNLKVPGLNAYLTSGQRWVNNIVTMVDAAFGIDQDEAARNKFINDQGRASNMRQYGHWVESLDLGNGNVIDDEDTIEKTLDVLSTDDDIRKAYFDGVKAYMEDATVALVAVPATDGVEESGLPRFPHLLPLDVMNTFFILLVQKVGQIENREA